MVKVYEETYSIKVLLKEEYIRYLFIYLRVFKVLEEAIL